MKATLTKKVTTIALATACAVSMLAIPAQAAGKKNIYVVSKISIKRTSDGNTHNSTATYTYNKNGFVTKWQYKYGTRSVTAKYSYNKKRQLSKETVTNVDGTEEHSICKYTGKGKLKQIDVYWSKKAKKPEAYYKCKLDKNDNLIGLTVEFTHPEDPDRKSFTYTYKYNKNGLILKSNNGNSFTYNKKGDVVKESSEWETVKYTNKYDKNKNLSQVVKKTYADGKLQITETIKYTYKKVAVSNSDYKAIKRQQQRFPISFDGSYHGFSLIFW